MPRVLGLITARGGSRGIPGKNIKPLGGLPLVAWSARAALAAGCVDRLIISTDSEHIASVARAHGVEVPFMRPAELAQDHSPHMDVILHALDAVEAQGFAPSHLLLLQPTSPFRAAQDIRGALELALERQAPSVVAVTEAPHPQLLRHTDAQGALVPVVPPRSGYLRRQELEPTYQFNGALYLTKVEVIRSQRTLVPQGTLAWVMPPERSVDLDTPADWHLAEYYSRTLLEAP